MCRFWKECVEAISRGFGTRKTNATLIVLAMAVWLLAMVVQTWFIWAGLIGTVIAVFMLLWATELSLRLYYWIRSWDRRPQQRWDSISNEEPAETDMLPSPCSNVQGQLTITALDEQDASVMAARILQHATVRNASVPGWLCFRAIGRACPPLSQVGRAFTVVISRLRSSS